MNRKIRNLWVKALRGSSASYRQLGILFFTGKGCRKDRTLAKLCLQRAVDLGDQRAYFIYHRIFSRNKKVIDDESYRELLMEYINTRDAVLRKQLRRYLCLGTRQQKETARHAT